MNYKREINYFVFALILLSSFVLAAHVITSNISVVNEDVSALYNITINNSDLTLAENITQVNVTLPTNFTFAAGTNSTSFGVHTFANTSNVLSWENTAGLVMNLTLQSFLFNATASTTGTFNITVTTKNSTLVFTNISINVNNTAPIISFDSPTLAAGSNKSQTSIPVNISVVDNEGTIIINLFYSNSTLINSTSSSTSPFFLNFTELSEGVYRINSTVNDTTNNLSSTETRIVTLDTTPPSVSLSETSDTEDSLNISISITESGSGSNTCTSSRGGASITGSGNSRILFEDDLECDTEYTYNVTCTDFAGNVGSDLDDFRTEDCSDSGSSGGTSTTTTSSSYWTSTYVQDDKNLQEKGSFNIVLGEKNRVRIKVNGTQHYVGIINVASSGVTVNVSSVSQQAKIDVSESAKFEVTNDNYYDLIVKINSVNTTGDKTNITVSYTNEKLPEVKVQTVTETNATGNQTAGGINKVNGRILESKWFWIGLIITLLAVLGIAYYLKLGKSGIESKIKIVADKSQNIIVR